MGEEEVCESDCPSLNADLAMWLENVEPPAARPGALWWEHGERGATKFPLAGGAEGRANREGGRMRHELEG